MCFKRNKKAKCNPKGSNRITSITNKQIAQYIVIDLERMQNEEMKSKELPDMITTSFEINSKNYKNEKKESDEGQLQAFSYNFMQAPPPHFNKINVLNEENILRTDEINLENI